MSNNRDRNIYSSDKERVQKSAKVNIEFCLANLNALRSVDRSKKKVHALFSFVEMLRLHESFTAKQLNLIDGIYESTMKGLKLPSVNPHIDKKRKGLRF